MARTVYSHRRTTSMLLTARPAMPIGRRPSCGWRSGIRWCARVDGGRREPRSTRDSTLETGEHGRIFPCAGNYPTSLRLSASATTDSVNRSAAVSAPAQLFVETSACADTTAKHTMTHPACEGFRSAGFHSLPMPTPWPKQVCTSPARVWSSPPSTSRMIRII